MHMKRMKYFSVYLLAPDGICVFSRGGSDLLFSGFRVFCVSFRCWSCSLSPITAILIRKQRSHGEEQPDLRLDTVSRCSRSGWDAVSIFFTLSPNTPVRFRLKFFGRIFAMGLMCGVMGINIGHELGHRPERINQLLGEIVALDFTEHAFSALSQ